MDRTKVDEDALDALVDAAKTLREYDLEKFGRLVALAKAFAAVYERPDEPDDVFASRLIEIRGGHKATA